jgi:CBS domain-containing protein
MTRQDAHLDAIVRDLGVAYYRALHGDATAADVSRAVERVAEAFRDIADDGLSAAEAGVAALHRTGRCQVRDVMTAKVVAVTEETGYKRVAQLLRAHHLTALPVITSEGRVAGLVSEADLLRKQERQEDPARKPGWQRHATDRAKAEAQTAAELMTAPAVTIGPEALLGTAARLMNAHRVDLLPVVDAEGKMVGIVSRRDLLSVFLRLDAEVASEVSSVLTDILVPDPRAVRVSVHDGVVTLRGRLASQEQVPAAARLVSAIDGVVAVRSKLTAPPPEDWPGAGYHIPGLGLACHTGSLSISGGGTATAGRSEPALVARRSAPFPARRQTGRSGPWRACGASRLPGSGRLRDCGPARSTSLRFRSLLLAASCSGLARCRESTDAQSRRRTTRLGAAPSSR